ncbi:MAG: UDP-N-acetylmuramate dehydrogenase [Sulfurimonas sp.]|jgi:UDP-N-acetylmuramate dehydrogenase|nr:UDP-N-acetylmuramate dehydrogenase [Sulfurimonas sp.]MBU1216535.1 UDP-N-acetylmuramate dehydrogenase [bacterium]MBU1433544.1 UDP-N-acetylmuramate dehydrogenase [bacterium]MBU1503275.1 UDP-N-acetylmuramate dehydrogenase [bacterium]MBU3938396.1 UDP-N-acetylmuramate dehydrogenase [bacterium]
MQTKQVNFSKFSSMRIGPTLEIPLLEDCLSYSEQYYIIGSCNNVLIGTQPPKLMMLGKKYDYIKIEDDVLKIGAATPSGKVASFCKKNNIANFEFLSHLPGKMGGLVYMNAGLKEYEIFNYILSIQTCSGNKRKEEVEFGYRYTNINEPILEVGLALSYGFDEEKVSMFKKMRSNQPSTPSAGSCFKNPEGDYAGRLIEAVGLKGMRIGEMEFSTEHANFLVNHKDGKFEDAIHLIQEAQKRVFKEFGIWLECEIAVLDERYMGAGSPLLKANRSS